MFPEASGRALLTVLNAEHAEWRPLLALIEEALPEIERPAWTQSVPSLERFPFRSRAATLGRRDQCRPTIGRALDPSSHGDRGRRVTEEPFVAAVTAGRLDTLALFEAAVSRDGRSLDDLAQVAGTTATC